MQTQTFILPAYWANGLINNDWSGTSKEDKTEALEFLKENDLPAPVQCSEESYFQWSNDANDIGGDVLEYTFLTNSK